MNFKFSGHESFPCRYAWLPKAYIAIEKDPHIFNSDEEAMVVLGVGKNMVRAIRFWVQVSGIAENRKEGFFSTEFGKKLLSSLDPYLEDIRTLWLLHWKISTNYDEPLFAWDYMLNRWQHPEISRSEVLRAFEQEAIRLERKLSQITLEQHFDTFLHSYIPTRGRKGIIQEDNLDCPLVELELIQKVGERKADQTGRRESIYIFRREEKPEITPELFIYCLNDFWRTRFATEKTLSFREVSIGIGSPGQIFKIPESNLRDRLEAIEKDSGGYFQYKESATMQFLIRNDDAKRDLLSEIYELETMYA